MNATGTNKSVKRTLMFRNQELLDFEADPATKEVRVLDAPKAHDVLLESLGFGGPDLEAVVAGVIERRRMADNRDDNAQILDGFGARTAFELALRGHGLSLSDHLWYRAPGSTERWEDVNFFDNEWDTTFCESVMTRDYDRLASCSPDVPDITTRGFLKKTWERTDDGIYLLKEANHENGADLVGSLLAAKLCCRLYGQDVYQPLSIERRYGRDVAVSPLLASRDEELVQGPRLFAIAGIDAQEMVGIRGHVAPHRYVDVMSRAGLPDAMAQVAKMFAFMSLALLGDFHSGNYGVIRNSATGALRAAPPFDYDRAFGFPSDDAKIKLACAVPSVAVLLCARDFSNLDPSWDWSWFDPQALEGFEDCIKEAYSPRDDLPPNFSALMTHLFVEQRAYVNEVARG